MQMSKDLKMKEKLRAFSQHSDFHQLEGSKECQYDSTADESWLKTPILILFSSLMILCGGLQAFVRQVSTK